MISIILSWLYISVLIFPFGIWMLDTIDKIQGNTTTEPKSFSLILISGLMVSSAICVTLALIIPLGIGSNITLLSLSLLLYLYHRTIISHQLQSAFKILRHSNPILLILFIGFIFIISYLSYLPSSHHDDGLYYSTSIKWLQEYGTIKGLANLNPRIGFNSSWHILQANFGFHFLSVGLFNDMNGLLFLYVFLYSLGGLRMLISGSARFKYLLRAFFMIPALAYHFGSVSDIVLYNVNFLSSPSPDIPVTFIIWLTFVMFVSVDHRDRNAINPNDVLCILFATWMLTIKLTAAPVILLASYLTILLVVRKKYRLLVFAASVSIVLVLPWLVRNVLLSGYLIFPYAELDFFNVDWKVSKDDIMWHQNAVMAFAVGTDLSNPFTLKLTDWFPDWFFKQEYIKQVSLVTAAIATVTYTILTLFLLVSGKRSAIIQNSRLVAANLILVIAIFFWLNKAPDFRFGFGFIGIYLVMFMALTFRFFLENFAGYSRYAYYLFLAFLITIHYKSTWNMRNLVAHPLAYRQPSDFVIEQIDNVKVIVVKNQDSWNSELPAANEHEFYSRQLELRGTSVKSGFRRRDRK